MDPAPSGENKSEPCKFCSGELSVGDNTELTAECVHCSPRSRFVSEDDTFLDNAINNNKVTVFSKTWCPFCVKVQKILADNDIEAYIIQLDNLGEFGERLQKRLKEQTGQGTVPLIYVNGHHIGGCSDVQQSFSNGTFFEYLEGIFSTYQFDLVVIGGGSGGLAAAKEAVKSGKRVALCDFTVPSPNGTTWGLGGTCVNVGCIPKKLMHKASIIHEDMLQASLFGWNIRNITEINHDWQAMITAINDYIRSLNWKYKKQLRERSIVYYNALASFVDRHTIELDGGDGTIQVTSQNFIIAVGGRPHYPDIPGAIDYCITSDDLFSLPEKPGKTLIVGASYIALECAGFLNGLGVDCTVMVRSILLRGFDQEMANKIGSHLEDRGVKFVWKCVPIRVSPSTENKNLPLKVEAIFEDESPYEELFDTVILAVGRDASTTLLQLDKIGVDTNSRNGKIIVNFAEQTSVKTIFAVGDVIDGRMELTPVAIQAGKLLARRLFHGSEVLTDYNCVPTTVFTPLEYGCVGVSEDQAHQCYKTGVEVFHNLYEPLEFVLSEMHSGACFAKLICVKESTDDLKVVGLHIFGPNAGEIVQGFALAIKLGATKQQFDELIGIHPTCAEVFTTLSTTKSSGEELVSGGC